MALHDPARDRFISTSLARAGCFEPFLTELVLGAVRPGDVAIDLGAHIGYYTLLLAGLVGATGRVLAFEPDPDNFALLRHNVGLNAYDNVELFPLAASDRCGPCRLFRSGDNAGDHRIHAPAEPRLAVDAETITVDAVFAGRPCGVDFVKVDVQGSEGAALEGMSRLLARSPRVTMLVEFSPAHLHAAGYGAERLLSRLASLGFWVYEVDETHLTVRRADPRQLLAGFPATSDDFTNLWCVKAPLPTPPSARRLAGL